MTLDAFAAARAARRVLFAHLYGIIVGVSVALGTTAGWDTELVIGTMLIRFSPKARER